LKYFVALLDVAGLLGGAGHFDTRDRVDPVVARLHVQALQSSGFFKIEIFENFVFRIISKFRK
jgi:hypothetical protein